MCRENITLQIKSYALLENVRVAIADIRIVLPEQAIIPNIRWIIRRDMPEVFDIENRCFERPWSEDDFIRCLRQRNCIGRVAEYEERVVGFLIYEIHKYRAHYLNFAVHPAFRRQRVGMALARDPIIRRPDNGLYELCSLMVRESDYDAQIFFREMRHKTDTDNPVIRNYFDDTNEDGYALQWQRRLDPVARYGLADTACEAEENIAAR